MIRDDDDEEVDMLDDYPGLCRAFCSVEVVKRSRRGSDASNRSPPIAKRVFTPVFELGSAIAPEAARDQYMVTRAQEYTADSIVIPEWAEDVSPGDRPKGLSSAVTKQFGNEKFSFGMREICGCTMLVVGGSKRVYIGWSCIVLAVYPLTHHCRSLLGRCVFRQGAGSDI